MSSITIYTMRQLENGTWEVEGMEPLPACSRLTANLRVFRDHPAPRMRERAFWDVANELWNSDELPEKLFEKHEWSRKMIREAIENKYLAIGGAGSSGKSHVYAGWGIINWLAAPDETLVLMLSTTLSGARKRIWGSFIKLSSVLDGVPLQVRDSIGAASYKNPAGKVFDTAGLHLIAAEKSRTKDAVAKFIGLKQKRVILIADELADISEAIIQAGLSNLSGNPSFQLIGLANPNSKFDAFGVWSEPKGGWDSIIADRDYEWETKYGGRYLRFDGELSPNIRAGRTVYPWLPTQARVDEAKANLGEKSRGYMRMVRAVFFDNDEASGVFTETDIIRNKGGDNTPLRDPILVAGFDPAFTNGGDRSILYTAEVGIDEQMGQHAIRFIEYFALSEDTTNKAVPRSYQIAQQVIKLCADLKVPLENLAVDSTGAGGPFCDVLAGESGGQRFLRVPFGNVASDLQVSENSQLTGRELYSSRATELWFAGRELLRCFQLRGVNSDLAKEMSGREYEVVKAGERLKMRLESKILFKARMGFSPDIADAAFLAVDAARQRVGLWAQSPPEDPNAAGTPFRRFRTFKDLDVASQSSHAFIDHETYD